MPLRKIAQLGHPVLRQTARPFTQEELLSTSGQQLVDDLIATMRDADGAGLAAPQIYESVRVCVIEVGQNPRYPYKPPIPLTVLVNPCIAPVSERTFSNFEGCLSVPNLRGRVNRFCEVQVSALDRFGQKLSFIVRGLSAGTFQHELDHLDGRIFVDRVQDPTTLCTWTEFDRHHKETFVKEAKALVAEFGS